LVYGPTLAIFGVICLYLLRYYDLTRQQHEATLHELARLRSAAQKTEV